MQKKLKNTDLISIITPFYQAERYLAEAIESVLNQSHQDWELLLINDGSTDNSKKIALSYHDPRIRYFEQANKGVSAARNIGLSNMKGQYFCFFDSDDYMPKDSLKSRLTMFGFDKSIKYVDGVIVKMNHDLSRHKSIWFPKYIGNPLKDLINLNAKSFFGPSWMIYREPNRKYLLNENLTHSEDLFFYMELAREGGVYAYTNKIILNYRDTPNSAMKNLTGLENGYRFIESQIREWKELSESDLRFFCFKYKKAMSLAYLRKMKINNAIRIWF